MQSYLFGDEGSPSRTVNVASVPQRSPFRYPGGKTWFVPRLREWLKSQASKPKLLIEPFAGGAVSALSAVFESLVEKALLVELDAEIAAVWQTILDGDAEWLALRILDFEMSRENAIKELKCEATATKERAFQTLIKNRINHGGILAAGSGFLKHGESGKGVLSRWYPATLARRLREIDHVRQRLEFIHGDAFEVLKLHELEESTVYFIDPPYTAGGKKAGSRLYNHYELDHEKLFTICEQLRGDFLMTYDNADEVRLLAKRHGFVAKPIPMKNTHHAEMTELVIGRDLDWMFGDACVHEVKQTYGKRSR